MSLFLASISASISSVVRPAARAGGASAGCAGAAGGADPPADNAPPRAPSSTFCAAARALAVAEAGVGGGGGGGREGSSSEAGGMEVRTVGGTEGGALEGVAGMASLCSSPCRCCSSSWRHTSAHNAPIIVCLYAHMYAHVRTLMWTLGARAYVCTSTCMLKAQAFEQRAPVQQQQQQQQATS